MGLAHSLRCGSLSMSLFCIQVTFRFCDDTLLQAVVLKTRVMKTRVLETSVLKTLALKEMVLKAVGWRRYD